jgi:ketosteroid isomerase-like protein
LSSEQAIRLVERVFGAFTDRDAEALLEIAAPDIEFTAPTAARARAGAPYVGHDGMRRYLSDVTGVWRELRVIPQTFRAKGDCVLATGRVYARDHEGAIVDSPAGWIFLVRGDAIACGRVFENAEDAVAAFDARPDPDA